ncbi:TetR/AcrR family transcriptional regulator [Solicola gregarius]|uniref:TetR family transcriptional regulator n=1 Tax=Solicola gregarius TaxID=2908642 RepID=A0AA46TLL1_9ACTN|nr:TetR family transcriptional regulator [Solicola gregarius]UYM07495.1 TetR family transcriptional regulator [Solicola gregarius]
MPRPREFDEQSALDSAVEAFWTHTYAGTSTAVLCESTGLSRSSLYNTFTGKSDLYQCALRRYAELKSTQRNAYLDIEGTGRERLERLLGDVLREQWASDERRVCLVLNAAVEVGSADQAVADLARGNLESFRDLISQLIAEGQRDGSFTSTAPARDLAAVVHAALNGAQIADRVATSDAAGRATVKTLMSML